MRSYFIIGEAQLDIAFGPDGQASGSTVGATLLRTACLLAQAGKKAYFAAEIGQDPVGDIVVEHLRRQGVDTSMIDRFAGGATQVALDFAGRENPLRYVRVPDDESFDMVWPRVEAGDVVVFGEMPAIEQRTGSRIDQFVAHARERQASVVYFPGLDTDRVPRATRIMPRIFENLEQADLAVCSEADLQILFGTSDAEAAHRNHLCFHVGSSAALSTALAPAEALAKVLAEKFEN